MSYRGQNKGSYGQQKRGSGFLGRFRKGHAPQQETQKAGTACQAQVLVKFATISPNLGVYLWYPWPNVDIPDIADLAKFAALTPTEILIRDTSQHDIESMDRKFLVLKKSVAEKLGYMKQGQTILVSDPRNIETERYINNLRATLEPQGFTIIPL